MTAAGLTPYSVEAMSCFLAGTRCEQTFLRKTEEEGFPETMCSYHRVFLGAALSGLVPNPKCMIYTNLACDSNMMTFPYLKQKNMLPGFFIDVPYDKNEDSVKYVADGFQKTHYEDPYEAMTEKMVNCIYNGSVRQRIQKAKELAAQTNVDGGILFTHWGCKGTIGASSLIKIVYL